MAKEQSIALKPLNIQRIKLKLVGTSPYMPEPMDMNVVELIDKKKSKQTYEKDNTSEEDKVKTKFYYTEDQEYGMPSSSIFRAGVDATKYILDRSDGGKTRFREAVIILGNIIPLQYESLTIDRRWGKTQGQKKSPRLIVRNAFIGWSCIIEVEFNAEVISAEQVVNILEYAGFHIGVGGFRKEKGGNCGSFRVTTVE